MSHPSFGATGSPGQARPGELAPVSLPGNTLSPPAYLPGGERAQTPRTWRHEKGCHLSRAQWPFAASMTEDTGCGSVEWHLREYLKEFGLKLAYHPWRQHAARAREGWPDWAITGPGGFMVRELKQWDKDPTKAQEAWLESLCAAGLDVSVWKPCCVLSGRMARELAALAGIGAR